MLSAVKCQGHCGSCRAFSATQALVSQLVLTLGGFRVELSRVACRAVARSDVMVAMVAGLRMLSCALVAWLPPSTFRMCSASRRDRSHGVSSFWGSKDCALALHNLVLKLVGRFLWRCTQVQGLGGHVHRDKTPRISLDACSDTEEHIVCYTVFEPQPPQTTNHEPQQHQHQVFDSDRYTFRVYLKLVSVE